MKKYIPLLLAAAVFVSAILLLQPEARAQVVILTGDLPAGHVLAEADLAVRELPVSFRPSDAVEQPAEAVGQSLKTDRSKGDILRLRHLGESLDLGSGERAIAVRVDDVSGLGGLIAPGDTVGLTAVIFGREAAYSKVTMEGFRVIYVSPEFRAGFTQVQSSGLTGGGAAAIPVERASEGIVVLAVPSTMVDVKYDFTSRDGSTTIQKVNAVELIAAITSSGNARIILYKLPPDPDELLSPGLYLPDLVILPTPTPEQTPTESPPDVEE
ncbi:MAG: Flp pilus assembly protein CpaB [Anaerolineales bacterium]